MPKLESAETKCLIHIIQAVLVSTEGFPSTCQISRLKLIKSASGPEVYCCVFLHSSSNFILRRLVFGWIEFGVEKERKTARSKTF